MIGKDAETGKTLRFQLSRSLNLMKIDQTHQETLDARRVRIAPWGTYLTCEEDLQDVHLGFGREVLKHLQQHPVEGWAELNANQHHLDFQAPQPLLNTAVLAWLRSLPDGVQVLSPHALHVLDVQGIAKLTRDLTVLQTARVVMLVQQHPGELTKQDLALQTALTENEVESILQQLIRYQVFQRGKNQKVSLYHPSRGTIDGGDFEGWLQHPLQTGG